MLNRQIVGGSTPRSYVDRQPMTFDRFISQQFNRRGMSQNASPDQSTQESEMEIETASETDSELNNSVTT